MQTSAQSRQVETSSSVPNFLYSSSDEETTANIKTVWVTDQGSIPQCVRLQVQSVPAYGLFDSGADITIIGGALFKKVTTVAKLGKHNFMQANKVPRTCDQRSFKLDGRMNLDISLGDHTMTTPVYIKMVAHDQLLLLEDACRQLRTIHYHPNVGR